MWKPAATVGLCLWAPAKLGSVETAAVWSWHLGVVAIPEATWPWPPDLARRAGVAWR